MSCQRLAPLIHSRRLPLIGARMAPDCIALTVVVVVVHSLRLSNDFRHGHTQLGELAQVHSPCPVGWRRAQAQPIWFAAHDGAIVAIADQYVHVKDP